ncbi:hypothetical protein IMZ48_21970 [Candidatus Bathyarchaeota archaeon]|nr:hypothetical protein [Candidatus Bathyarchaeota archaeon]
MNSGTHAHPVDPRLDLPQPRTKLPYPLHTGMSRQLFGSRREQLRLDLALENRHVEERGVGFAGYPWHADARAGALGGDVV